MIRLCILLVLTSVSFSFSQIKNEDVSRLQFIKRDKNVIHNDSALFPFFELLKQRSDGNRDLVSVAHIGDSHIQADFFSGRIREELQRRYGNAGRGLVFPYRAARSNEPYTIKSSAKGSWKTGRNVINRDSLPMGITGFTIETRDTAGIVQFKIINVDTLNYGFKTIEIFCENGKSFARPILRDSSLIDSLVTTSSSFQKEIYHLPVKTNSCSISRSVIDTLTPMRIYGMNLLNGDKGVLYHTIGVNGAEFRHYIESRFFFSQLKDLTPDLVIVSLGTNESFGRAFSADAFVRNMKSFADSIQTAFPGVILLFTVPADAYRGRYRNRNVEVARTMMISFCDTHNYPYWDLFEVMGGAGSMAKWYSKGLTAKDRLHFKPKGYAVQAYLFNEAFLKSYHAFSGGKQQ